MGTIPTPVLPPNNPRSLWLDSTRTAPAQQQLVAAGFSPDPSGDAWTCGLGLALFNDTPSGQSAIEALAGFTISDDELAGVASDSYRWNDWVPVDADWTNNMWVRQADPRFSDFVYRYDGYVATMQGKSWGGPDMPWSNYFWGYFRNEFNWAVCQGDMSLLMWTLSNRWDNFVANAAGTEGIPQEGPQYGPYQLCYPIMPFLVAKDLGRDILQETDFFQNAVGWLCRWITAQPVEKNNTGDYQYQLFPWADCELNGGHPLASTQYIGDFLAVIATYYGTSNPAGGLAAYLYNKITPPTSWWVKSVMNLPPAIDPATILDKNHYAPATSTGLFRNSWDGTETQVMIQAGYLGGGHAHFDIGNFQICRGRRWLTKESTGYNTQFAWFQSSDTVAHNCLTFNGIGYGWPADDSQPWGSNVLRSDIPPSGPAYIIADLTPAYTNNRLGTPVSQYCRHFIWLPNLETLILYDQAIVYDASVSVEFNLHVQAVPSSLDVGTYRVLVDDQDLTIFPAWAATVAWQDEGQGMTDDPSYYQQHVVLSASGQIQYNLPTILQARDAIDADLTVTRTAGADTITLTLTHPTKGQATVTLPTAFGGTGGAIS